MWGNYALSLYRTLARHRLYAALNTLGLALGIAVCTILLLVVRFETGFDRWMPGGEAIFRVNQIGTWPGRPPVDAPSTQAVLLPHLLNDYPQIQAGTRLMESDFVVRSGEHQAFERVILADAAMFDVFPLPFVYGDKGSALADTSSLVISQAMARKYFGTEAVLGRRITVVVDGDPRDYRITGVIRDVPADSNLNLDFIGRYSPDVLPRRREEQFSWGSNFLHTYLRLKHPSDAAAIQADLKAFVDRTIPESGPYPSSKFRNYKLLPLSRVHFYDAKTNDTLRPPADPLFIGALGVMGVVTLLIAVVNYVSLATARAGMRAREVAVRKVMGATRRALIAQFVAESLAIAAAAGLIAAALVELALPGVSAVLGEPIRMAYFGADGVALPLVALCVLVGLMAGVYPAFALSAFRPASVLASARTPGGGRAGARMREVLAVGQFAIAISLMICTAVIFGQMQFLRHADIGFRRDGLLIVRGLGKLEVAPRMGAIVDAFRETPGVISVTASDRRPAGDSQANSNVMLLSNPQMEPILAFEKIGPDYFQTYGLKVVAGRALDMAHRLDDKGGISGEIIADRGVNIVVNEGAARALGFTNPRKIIGERLGLGRTTSGKRYVATIVGVVRDVRFDSPRNPPPPQTYQLDSALGPIDHPTSWAAAVRVRDGDQTVVRRRLEVVWRNLAAGTPFQADTVEGTMKRFYDADARRGQLFAAGAVLSAAIACLGLYGLAAFNTSRRVKEIGIRKTLGASTADVLRLLVGEFLRPVLWANLIAWPVSWFAMRSWLAGFDQRIDLNPAYFLAPSIAAVLVAVLTVAEQAIRVSRAEPSRALRYE